MKKFDVLSDKQEEISGGEIVSAPGVDEFTAAEPHSESEAWLFRIFIIIGLALVVYLTFSGRLFQPLFQAAKAAHWSELIVRPSLWWGMMGMVLLVIRSIVWVRYRPFPSVDMADAPSLTDIIPAYNEGPMVRKSIDSVAAASYPHDRLEIFVVDDGCKDDT